jgi:hypothetical protein
MSAKSDDELIQAYLMREQVMQQKIAQDKARANAEKVNLWMDIINLDDEEFGNVYVDLANGERLEFNPVVDENGNNVFIGKIPGNDTDENPDSIFQLDNKTMGGFLSNYANDINDVTRDRLQ